MVRVVKETKELPKIVGQVALEKDKEVVALETSLEWENPMFRSMVQTRK